MKHYLSATFLATLTLLLFNACTTEPDLTNVPVVSYKTDVQRILSANCSFNGCHGHDVGSYNSVMSFGDVKAGNAHGSKLYRVMTGRDPFNKMPPSGYNEIPRTDLKTIYLWIEQGAKDN